MGEIDARRDVRATRLLATLFCALAVLVGGTWAVTMATASPGADDDVVSIDCPAPIEVAPTRRRLSRPLCSRPRRRHLRRPRTRTRLGLRSHVLRRGACVTRRGPPTLVDC